MPPDDFETIQRTFGDTAPTSVPSPTFTLVLASSGPGLHGAATQGLEAIVGQGEFQRAMDMGNIVYEGADPDTGEARFVVLGGVPFGHLTLSLGTRFSIRQATTRPEEIQNGLADVVGDFILHERALARFTQEVDPLSLRPPTAGYEFAGGRMGATRIPTPPIIHLEHDALSGLVEDGTLERVTQRLFLATAACQGVTADGFWRTVAAGEVVEVRLPRAVTDPPFANRPIAGFDRMNLEEPSLARPLVGAARGSSAFRDLERGIRGEVHTPDHSTANLSLPPARPAWIHNAVNAVRRSLQGDGLDNAQIQRVIELLLTPGSGLELATRNDPPTPEQLDEAMGRAMQFESSVRVQVTPKPRRSVWERLGDDDLE